MSSAVFRPMTQVEGYRCEVSYGGRNPINRRRVFLCFAAVPLGPTVTPAFASAAQSQEPGFKSRRACVQLCVP
ncbi:hypothetical protein BU25DRAFT_413474 [Macroventuria anomochaeta]|uniref:Uncharacterized protein n=1 Tax=Macroventuria anomochaeta TaxID=301207 RepID=A0ACB6RUJ5_9PLEO|nr:uncharacterized protein BU25DRAFT_413474 [Macroventuria anomochaeta]KAF2624577.1 hypothetical protein BU25DRAFT_413474 [Macroventuria anomochaeta]